MKIKFLASALAAVIITASASGCGYNAQSKCDESKAALQTEETTQAALQTTEQSQSNAAAEHIKLPDKITSGSAVILGIEPIAQGSELPTGCEITSLAMVLNYYSLNADKLDLADNYLEKGEIGKTDFRKAFAGNPRDAASYGCYAPVIKNTAEKYLKAHNSSLTVHNITGTYFSKLFEYVESGIPVIVWGTLDCAEGYYSETWNIDGREVSWYAPEHCMVLCGYDYEMNEVWAADPMYGDIRSYDMDLFEERYNELQKQAVVISEQ